MTDSKYLGSLDINGQPTLFIIDDQSHLISYTNQGGNWIGTDLTKKTASPPVSVAMCVTTMGNPTTIYCAFALDAQGYLCLYSTTDGTTWKWETMQTSTAPQLQSTAGTKVVAGLLNVFGISTTNELWTCINQGGTWIWYNLCSPPIINAPDAVQEFVGYTSLGQDSDACLVLRDGPGEYYTCANDNSIANGTWYWHSVPPM